MEKASCNIQNSPTHDPNHEDEVNDTLSLSDFMIYNNTDDPQDFYPLENQNLINRDIHDDDQFEFSSELLKTSLRNNSVVFCGKIIPYKESSVSQNSHMHESKRQQKKHHSQRWRLFRFFKKSSKSKSNISELEKLDLKYEVPIRRVSILASATHQSRWYFLMFGFGSSRFPGQMHIRDLKKRQTSMGTKDGIMQNTTISGSGSGSGNGNCGGIGSWSLVRFLGCGGGGGGDVAIIQPS